MPTTIPTTTSSTRPGSPSTGDAYFETDTKNYIIYDGANWYVYNYDESTAFSNTLSLSFDGNDDLITNFQAPATTTYSVSMWLKSTDTTSKFAFIDDSPTVGGQGSFQIISPSGGNFYILFKNGSTANLKNGVGGTGATLDLRDGLWHHLAVTINGTSLKIYKDGGDAAINSGSPSNNQGTPFVSETTTTSNSWSSNVGMAGNSGTNYVIGSQGYTASTYHFNGVLDEVAFFSTELSGANISAIYNSGVPNDVGSQGLNLSPIAYFRMGDGASDTDSSGSAASNGQSVGTVTSLVGGYTGTQSTTSRKPTYSNDVPS